MAEVHLASQLTRIESMTNVELRAELKQRGCPTSGNKKDLLAKLRTALQNEYEQKIQQSSMNHAIGSTQNETPITRTSLPNPNQISTQHPSQVNVTMLQTIHSAPVPVIPTPQQLSMSAHQQIPSINLPQVNITPVVSSPPPPEKKTRSRSKKPSVDSRSDEIENTTSLQPLINNDSIILDTSVDDTKLEVQPSARKSTEEKPNDIEQIGKKPTVGNNSAKSDSIIEKIPLANEQNVQSIANEKVQKSTTHMNNNQLKNDNEVINQPSNTDVKSMTTKKPEIISTDESVPVIKEAEKGAPQQQLKPSRSQPASFLKGFNRSTNNKINLSSEILKTLISDLNLASESAINDELDALMNDDNIEQPTNEPIIETNISSSDAMTIGELADQKHPSNRTVVMDVTAESALSNNDPMMKKKQNVTPARMSSMDGKANTVVTDEPIRIKNATAVYEPPSQILYIRGLTRPFSLFQLKELLSRYGTLVDGEFWLDKIKSQCFATYKTLEEAQNAREALDGCRWPATNPKTLSVRFGRQDEFEFSKTHDLSPDQMNSDTIDRLVQEQTNAISLPRSASPVNGIKPSFKMNRSVDQESDVRKQQKDIRSGFLITDEDEEEPEIIHEPPAKELDDYFRKTKAKPSIYWLPLSEEQIIERTRRQEERKAERDTEQKKRDLDENTRRSDSNSRRRSVSPREKRKRSSSPSRRDFKRY